MPDKKSNFCTGFFVLILFFLLMVSPAAAGYVYYTQDESVTSPEGLRISSYRLSGELPEVYVGDEITGIYMLQYESTGYNQLVIDQPGGLCFELTDPDGNIIRMGNNYIGKTIYPDDYIGVRETFSLNKPGVWKISPAYTVIAGNGMKKISSPVNWQVAEINVIGKEDPKPDLVIDEIMVDFDQDKNIISKISYIIKNTGDADSDPSTTALFVNDDIIAGYSRTGYLPSGESLTVFEPVDIKYSGSTSLVGAQADFYGEINESDSENNKYEAVFDNPGFELIFQADDDDNSVPEKLTDTKSTKTVITEYEQYPVQVQECSNMCFVCSVIGLLSVLLSVLSFALGYFYGLNKNCERELRWMRSKIDFLRSERVDSKTAVSKKDDDIEKEMEEKLENAIDNMKNQKDE